MTKIIVYEERGIWAAALRMELADPRWRIIETRTLDDCRQQLREVGPALLIVHVMPNNAEGTLTWLSRLSREFPRTRIVVVASREMQGIETSVRGWGAIYFTTSPRRLRPLKLAVERFDALTPQDSAADFRQEIWARLPWPTASGKA